MTNRKNNNNYEIVFYPNQGSTLTTIGKIKKSKIQTIKIGNLIKNINTKYNIIRKKHFFIIGGFSDNSFKIWDFE